MLSDDVSVSREPGTCRFTPVLPCRLSTLPLFTWILPCPFNHAQTLNVPCYLVYDDVLLPQDHPLKCHATCSVEVLVDLNSSVNQDCLVNNDAVVVAQCVKLGCG